MPNEVIDTAYKVEFDGDAPAVIKTADDGKAIPIEATSLGRLVGTQKTECYMFPNAMMSDGSSLRS